MDKSKLVITIERQYGSGGRIVGRMLADKLGIHFYDDEILSMTAEKSAVGEQYFRLADEKAGNNLLRRIVGGMSKAPIDSPKLNGDITSPENLFRFQSEVIRELAETESCVIVGRCADFVLSAAAKEDLIKIFVYADMPACIRRTMEVDGIVDNKQAMERVAQMTRQRREYHKYFTGKEWEDMDNYDLLINSSKLEYEQVVDIIYEYIRRRGYEV
jgi:hypothetical protein